MKYLYLIILLSVVSLSAMAQGINFEHLTLDEAIKKAKAENKLVFIDGYAVWCGPCKKMAATVFQEAEVGQYFDKQMIALKVDVERGEGPAIKRKYGISSLPGYVFIDGDGLVVYRFGAYMRKELFMQQVKLAVSYASDQNSVGRMAERYEANKNDEQFLRTYLDKLAETQSTGYTEVLEQYLTIQKSVPEPSKEMVELLAKHYQEIVFGGQADAIIQRNQGSDAWKLYVRKDIREIFQKIPKVMLEKTTDYAVAKRDTSLLDLALERAPEAGVKVDSAQVKRAHIYYYLNIGDGKKYKELVHDDNVAYIQSLDVQKLRDSYIDNQKQRAAGDSEALATRPFSVRISQGINSMVSSYAKFVETDAEKKEVLGWMKVAYDIMPGDAETMSEYANAMYVLGSDKAEAIKLKEEAKDLAIKTNIHDVKSVEIELDMMKAGEAITLE